MKKEFWKSFVFILLVMLDVCIGLSPIIPAAMINMWWMILLLVTLPFSFAVFDSLVEKYDL